jgi:ATP-dependent RNA helicase RhlE
MTFSELNLSKQLLRAVDDLGFDQPTTIQSKAFSVIMSGKDVVGLAQTGTGKTLAFLLPLLNLLKYSNQIEPRIIILVPTRELVIQVVEEVEKLSTYMSVRVGGVYGGANINTQKSMLMEGLDILVATPGRMLDLSLNGSLKLKCIQKLVIDEMDEMLNLGFRTQLKNILDVMPEKRQNLLFSATMNEDVELIIEDYFNSPQKIEAAAHGTPLEKIIQSGFNVPNFYTKVNLLIHLLESTRDMTKVLIFTGSKRLADLLHEIISEKFPDEFGIIHSNKSQNFRFNSLRQFQDGKHRGLIATDLVSRGLDISDVTHVVNFDMPDDSSNYIHRIGRTGRADKDGIAISFITKAEEKFQLQIEEMMKMKIPLVDLPLELVISEELIEQERPVIPGVNYASEATIKDSRGAFQEKKKKNTKVNLGGSYKIEIKKKYKKPKTRGQKR